MKKIYLLLITCIFTSIIQAQNFNLVKDINTSKDGNPVNPINNLYFGYKDNLFFLTASPYNASFPILNGVTYFAADDGMHGTELWRSDNTSGGTYMVKDITAGSASSSIQNLTVAGSKLYFTVSQVVYESDGTDAGTMPVPGITYNGDQTTCLTPVGNTLYFFTAVSRLWKTDGTQAGTSLVIDFRPTYSYSKDFLGQLTNVNGTVFFTTGTDNTSGAELWKSDGTAQGTVMVKDIYPGTEGSRPTNLTTVNTKIYFSADGGTNIGLWVSDGTENGTQPAVNNSGVSLIQMKDQTYLDPTPFPVINNTLFFKGFTASKGTELYKYDLNNTAAGITLVKDILPGAASSNPSNITAVNNTVYFSVTNTQGEQELWKSDGTKLGTVLIKNLGKGSPNGLSNFSAFNGALLFSLYQPTYGDEPWKSDGTSAGTIMIKDLYAGNYNSYPGPYTYFNNGISLFNANDGMKGFELWSTNGKSAGTQLIKNINNTTTASSSPNLDNSVTLNNQFYFSAFDPVYGNNLYVTNGTGAGTHLVKDINHGNSANPTALTVFNNAVYFAADSDGYASIYKTDGTGAGTRQVFTLRQQNVTVNMVAATNYLFAFFDLKDSGYDQLWVADNTDGFAKIQNVYRSSGGIATLGNNVYFSGYDSAHGTELWRASHNPGSAQLVKDIYPGMSSSYPNGFINYNNKLYFSAYDSSNTYYIYYTDGTKKGTQRIYPGNSPIAQANGKLFFPSYNTTVGNELYVSDGTAAGTKLLKDIYPGSIGSGPYYLTPLDSILYFAAYDNVHGNELWKTDGKEKNTVLVKDLFPGISSTTPQRLTTANGKLYFQGYYDYTYKLNLFVSDGTDAGTNVVTDAGLNGVMVNYIKGGGNKLYINGYTYPLGYELYAGVTPTIAPQVNNVVAKNIENKNFNAVIIGNPVQDELKLAINSYKTQQAQIIITDASGKMLINKSESLNIGINNVAYSIRSWVAGIYTLNVIATDGSVISLKAVKQ